MTEIQETMQTLAPVKATVVVEVPKERAFEVFTADMTSWWPATYKIGPADLKEAVLERRTGGRWYEIDSDGSQCSWGEVLAYEPYDRLVLNWQVDATWSFNETITTEVEVRFVEEAANRTRVELEHRNLERLGDGAPEMRKVFDSDGGWSTILGLFAQRVAE